MKKIRIAGVVLIAVTFLVPMVWSESGSWGHASGPNSQFFRIFRIINAFI